MIKETDWKVGKLENFTVSVANYLEHLSIPVVSVQFISQIDREPYLKIELYEHDDVLISDIQQSLGVRYPDEFSSKYVLIVDNDVLLACERIYKVKVLSISQVDSDYYVIYKN